MMGRAPCCDKANVKKGPWSPEEDAKLKSHIQIHGTGGNWISLPNKIGLKRCGKSCRLRWLNYLRPNLKHGAFTPDEDNLICNLYVTIGSRWSIIAAQLPGRTDNDIKNYWNTRLKKKLFANRRPACVTPPPPPPPPLPTLADHHALIMPQMEENFCYCNNLGQCVSCARDQLWEMNSALTIDEVGMYEAAAINCSSSMENVRWEEDANNLQFPHTTNYQPWDEPRFFAIT